MKSSNVVLMDELRKNFEKLNQEGKAAALKLFKSIGIDISRPDSKLTGTNVYGFIFQNKVYEADSHKSVFLRVSEIILKRFPHEQDKILQIQGRKKKYFSEHQRDFKHYYEKIPGTTFYADTNENAKQLNRRCQRILLLYGIDPSSLTVITD